MSFDYLFNLAGRCVARVDVRRWFLHKDDAGLGCGCHRCCLCGQPGIDAGLEALSCAIIRNGLSVGKVESSIDKGGTTSPNILITNGALTDSMAWHVTKRADFGARAVI